MVDVKSDEIILSSGNNAIGVYKKIEINYIIFGVISA